MKKNTGNFGNFSIVETVEGKKTLISIVPHRWVDGEFLMWPNKNAEILIKDHSSIPSPKWHKIPFIPKRKSIKTFVEAEAEVVEMSGHTDSDSEQLPPAKKFRTKGAAKQHSLQDLDFNEMMMNQGPSTSNGTTDHSANQPLTSKTMESEGQHEMLAPELKRSQPESDALLPSIEGHGD